MHFKAIFSVKAEMSGFCAILHDFFKVGPKVCKNQAHLVNIITFSAN